MKSCRAVPWSWLAALVVLASSVAGAQQIDETDVKIARRHFNDGSALYTKGKYDEALQEFQAALRVMRHPAFHYNIAKCYDNLERYEDAIINYERYLASGPKPSDVPVVRKRIATLRTRKLMLDEERARREEQGLPDPTPPRTRRSTPEEDGLLVMGEMNAVEAGKAPDGGKAASPIGSTAKSPATASQTEPSTKSPATNPQIAAVVKSPTIGSQTEPSTKSPGSQTEPPTKSPGLKTEPATKSPTVGSPTMPPSKTPSTGSQLNPLVPLVPPPAPQPDRPRLRWTWVAGGLAVGSIGAGAAMLVLAKSKYDDAMDPSTGCANVCPDETVDSIRNFQTIGWVLVGVGALFTVSAVVTGWLESRARESAPPSPPPPSPSPSPSNGPKVSEQMDPIDQTIPAARSRAALAPRLGLGAGGLRLRF